MLFDSDRNVSSGDMMKKKHRKILNEILAKIQNFTKTQNSKILQKTQRRRTKKCWIGAQSQH